MPACLAIGLGAAALIGGGTTLIGANEQSKATAAANTANQDEQAGINQTAWDNYLLARGLNTGANPAPTGTVPTSGATAANTKLPLWANVNVSGTPTQWTKTGTAPAPNNPTLTLAGAIGSPSTPTSPTTA